jgi:hypothetical protein
MEGMESIGYRIELEGGERVLAPDLPGDLDWPALRAYLAARGHVVNRPDQARVLAPVWVELAPAESRGYELGEPVGYVAEEAGERPGALTPREAAWLARHVISAAVRWAEGPAHPDYAGHWDPVEEAVAGCQTAVLERAGVLVERALTGRLTAADREELDWLFDGRCEYAESYYEERSA